MQMVVGHMKQRDTSSSSSGGSSSGGYDNGYGGGASGSGGYDGGYGSGYNGSGGRAVVTEAQRARLASLRTFEAMCAAAQPGSPELNQGVAAVAALLSEESDHQHGGGGSQHGSDGNAVSAAIKTTAASVLKGCSLHVACHAPIVERGAAGLVDLLMVEKHLR